MAAVHYLNSIRYGAGPDQVGPALRGKYNFTWRAPAYPLSLRSKGAESNESKMP